MIWPAVRSGMPTAAAMSRSRAFGSRAWLVTKLQDVVLPRRSGASRRLEEADQVADRVVAVLGVAEGELCVHLVAVTASFAGLAEIAGLLEVVDDLGRGPLGDPDLRRDIPEADGGLGGDDLE